MGIQLRKREKTPGQTPESVIAAGLRQAHAMYPARTMPTTIIRSLNEAGFVIMAEADLDAEIALAYQAGEEGERDR